MTNSSKLVRARASFVRTSPRKLRLVADAVRAMPPLRAVERLKLMPKRAAGAILEVYQQALGNAKNNAKISVGQLVTGSLQIQEGPRYKRRDKSHGARYDGGVRRKKTAHIILELEEKK